MNYARENNKTHFASDLGIISKTLIEKEKMERYSKQFECNVLVTGGAQIHLREDALGEMGETL
ncbi:unnamed protein product [Brassica rapa subsp. trilocularis]